MRPPGEDRAVHHRPGHHRRGAKRWHRTVPHHVGRHLPPEPRHEDQRHRTGKLRQASAVCRRPANASVRTWRLESAQRSFALLRRMSTPLTESARSAWAVRKTAVRPQNSEYQSKPGTVTALCHAPNCAPIPPAAASTIALFCPYRSPRLAGGMRRIDDESGEAGADQAAGDLRWQSARFDADALQVRGTPSSKQGRSGRPARRRRRDYRWLPTELPATPPASPPGAADPPDMPSAAWARWSCDAVGSQPARLLELDDAGKGLLSEGAVLEQFLIAVRTCLPGLVLSEASSRRAPSRAQPEHRCHDRSLDIRVDEERSTALGVVAIRGEIIRQPFQISPGLGWTIRVFSK